EARAGSKLSRHLLNERVPRAVGLGIDQNTPDAFRRRGYVYAGRDLDHENPRLRQHILPHLSVTVPKPVLRPVKGAKCSPVDGNARYAPRRTRECRSVRFRSRSASYSFHVSPSTPGAASRLSAAVPAASKSAHEASMKG